MDSGKIANMLLYAPYVGVYEVCDRIRKSLTMEEFFKKDGCYVEPDFDRRRQEIDESPTDNIRGDDVPLYVSEMREALRAGKRNYLFLLNWLKNSGDGVFTLLGDAGTGKTTFLHHLQCTHKEFQWRILDLKQSIAVIPVINRRIILKERDFASLHGKILSSIILEIRNFLFAKSADGNNDHAKSRENLQFLLRRYEERIADWTPVKEYAALYEQLQTVSYQKGDLRSDRTYCEDCASIFTEYFTAHCTGLQRDRDTEAQALDCALAHLLIVLKCMRDESGKKVVIAFDNIERFIGADEIYNKELTDFLHDMRGICDTYRNMYMNEASNINRFSRKYQFIVSMRNTTVRNHTPAESTDFKRHAIDLSSWFSIDEIFQAKLNWYKSKDISVIAEHAQNHIQFILEDFGAGSNGVLRGLRPKLDLIFNHDKRNIITILTDLFDSEHPTRHISTIDHFYSLMKTYTAMGNKGKDLAACARLAYRSIVWRCILERLHHGALINNIIYNHTTQNGEIADMNYIWKILTVLHNHSLANGGRETEVSGTERYMPFLDLFKNIYNEHGDIETRFYEDDYAGERDRLSRLLFYMNSYDIEKNNLFQFIDIQYNVDHANRVHLNNNEDLRELFMRAKNEAEKPKIRITTAGKAYLGYVAPSFEFISCIANKVPLLAYLPTEEELRTRSVSEQRCMPVIDDTLDEMNRYIEDVQPQTSHMQLLYRRTAGEKGLTFAERMNNSAFGCLVNFCDCIRRLVPVSDETAKNTKEELIRQISKKANDLTKDRSAKTDK